MNNYKLRYILDNISIIDGLTRYAHTDFDSQYKHCRCPNPQHEDKHPSAIVNRKENTVHCFACGFHGDLVDIVKAIYNIPFSECISKIANDYNLPFASNFDINKYSELEKAEFEKRKRQKLEKETVENISKKIVEILRFLRGECCRIKSSPMTISNQSLWEHYHTKLLELEDFYLILNDIPCIESTYTKDELIKKIMQGTIQL